MTSTLHFVRMVLNGVATALQVLYWPTLRVLGMIVLWYVTYAAATELAAQAASRELMKAMPDMLSQAVGAGAAQAQAYHAAWALRRWTLTGVSDLRPLDVAPGPMTAIVDMATAQAGASLGAMVLGIVGHRLRR